MKNLVKTKWFIFGTYLLLVLAALLIGFVLLQNNSTLRHGLVSFFDVAEKVVMLQSSCVHAEEIQNDILKLKAEHGTPEIDEIIDISTDDKIKI